MRLAQQIESSAMGALGSLVLSYPEFLLAALSFLSLAALRLALRSRRLLVPVSWPVVGMLPFVFGNLGRLLDAATDALRECGCTFMFRGPWLAGADFLVTCDPAVVHHCLTANFGNYDKGRGFAEMFEVVGDGLLVADAASWARQRLVVAAVFAAPAFRTFVLSTMARQAERLVAFLDHAAAFHNVVELEDVFTRFSLDVSYASVFADDLGTLSVAAAEAPMPAFGEATRVASEAVLFRHVVPAWWWKLLRWLNVGIERRHAEAKAVLDDVVYREIEKRKKSQPPIAGGQGEDGGGGGSDLLSMFMAWPRDPSMSDRERDQFLRDAAVGYMFAAKDLIVAALTWFSYMLCTHPHVEAAILAELRSLRPTAAVGKHAVFDADALRAAPYLHAAVLETLRLFPPAPFEEKEALGDDVLPDGTRVARGTPVVFCIYAMGRIEGIWGDDCREFRPERWLTGSGRVRHEPSHKFAVFNCGPRSCLGRNLGLSNLKIAAAAIIYNFRLELVEGQVVEPLNSVVLHTKNGLRVRVIRREAA